MDVSCGLYLPIRNQFTITKLMKTAAQLRHQGYGVLAIS
jgi:hypothetical protein